jgi:sarcosine oxidase subunit alpha
VTSSAFSVGRGCSIALGLLAGGQQRHGEELIAWSPVRNRRTRVCIGPPCSFDPEGTRLAR